MTPDEWAKWTDHHATLFDLRSEDDLAMFAKWRPLLAGFSLADMTEASNWIAANAASKYRTQHAELLIRRVTFRRADQTRKRREQEDREREGPDCGFCHGVGLVIGVPHPRAVSDGVWTPPYYTCAVTCRCRRGADRHERFTAEATQSNGRCPLPMSLDYYEAIVPEWGQLVQDRENRRKDQDAANETAATADRRAGPLDLTAVKRRIADRMAADRAAMRQEAERLKQARDEMAAMQENATIPFPTR